MHLFTVNFHSVAEKYRKGSQSEDQWSTPVMKSSVKEHGPPDHLGTYVQLAKV